MARIIFGLIIVVVGTIIVLKSEWIYQNVGPIPWAEAHLHTEGGSRVLYKIIGIVVVVIGFMIITNLMSKLLTAVLGKLFMGMVT